MHLCNKCYKGEPEVSFGWRFKARGILKYECKSCEKITKDAWYRRNRSKCISKATKHTKNLKDKFQQLKSLLKCEICQEDEPICLDFHHLYGKDFAISEQVGSVSWENLLKELEKCIPLCSNCHRKVHKYGFEEVKRTWSR